MIRPLGAASTLGSTTVVVIVLAFINSAVLLPRSVSYCIGATVALDDPDPVLF